MRLSELKGTKKTVRLSELNQAMSQSDNSIYAKGGDFDLKKRLGSFSEGPKVFGVPLKERILSGVQAGLPAMFGGAMNVEDSFPLMGQTAGNILKTENPLVGAATATAGAVSGQALRQSVKGMRGYEPSFGQVIGEIPRTGVPELLFRGAGKALAPTANALMINTAKVPTPVVRQNPRIGLDVLDQGVWGTKSRMAEKLGENIGKYEDEVRGAVRGSPEIIDVDPIRARFGDLRRTSKAGLKAEDVSAIDDIENQFLEQFPKKTVNESRQFVTTVGKSLKPQMKTVKGAATGVVEPTFDANSGKYINEIVTPTQYVENPSDIVALHRPGGLQRKITSVSPKTTYSVDPYTGPKYSISREVLDPRGMNLERGLDLKKAIYSETPDAAFRRGMSELPGKTEARRAVAQEINTQLKNKVPATAPILKKEASAIQFRDALLNRIINESKNVPMGKLPGMGAFGAAAAGRPDAGAGILFGNALVGGLRSGLSQSGMAKGLYELSKRKGLGAGARTTVAELLRLLTQA